MAYQRRERERACVHPMPLPLHPRIVHLFGALTVYARPPLAGCVSGRFEAAASALRPRRLGDLQVMVMSCVPKTVDSRLPASAEFACCYIESRAPAISPAVRTESLRARLGRVWVRIGRLRVRLGRLSAQLGRLWAMC